MELSHIKIAPTVIDIRPKLDSYDQGQIMDVIGVNFGNISEYLQEVVIDKVSHC